MVHTWEKKPKGVMDPFGLERGEEGLFPSCHSFWIVMATGLGILFLCFLYVVLQLCAFPASLSESRPLFKSRLLVLRSPHFKAKGNNYLPLSDRAIASHLFLPWIMNLIPKLGVWHAVGALPLHIVYNGFLKIPSTTESTFPKFCNKNTYLNGIYMSHMIFYGNKNLFTHLVKDYDIPFNYSHSSQWKLIQYTL